MLFLNILFSNYLANFDLRFISLLHSSVNILGKTLEKFDIHLCIVQVFLNTCHPMKFAIITGGWSYERDENIHAAEDVYNSLSGYHDVKKFIFFPDLIPEENKELLLSLKHFNPDFTFLCTTEELPIQGVLEFFGLKYSGSNVLTTALSLDKDKCKRLFQTVNIQTPQGILLRKGETIPDPLPFPFPLIVKPNDSGSSCGVRLIKEPLDLSSALDHAFLFSQQVLIEEYISGTEVTVPMLGDLILPPIEIFQKSGKAIFDYESKSNFKENVEYRIADLEREIFQNLKQTMRTLKSLFSIKSIFRADFIIKGKEIFLLELNTLPCLANGMMGVSARGYGWTYDQLLMHIAHCPSIH